MADAKGYVKRCDHCQKYAPVVREPPEMLTSINSPIPFALWVMDIFGPSPWPPLKGKFRKYCKENEIDLRFTYVARPQANGKAEVTNQIILDGLKKRIEKYRNNWVDEILPILWSSRTTCRVTTGATPFMLAYGAEAVVLVEISHSSPRIQAFNVEENEEGKRLALYLIDEVRDAVHAMIVEYQKKAYFYYNLRVKERLLKQGDLVLRKVEASEVEIISNFEEPSYDNVLFT
ncbi:uncharacterized protein LOC141680137 [Apium graveolens]|uniref:uncharacterized protein LOC141680137 n=1 Tax=Apium graveolens TaxID=4045 RepID=UPI003D7BFB60